MIEQGLQGGDGRIDDDLLTRAEASAFLAQCGVRLKPATLARMWSTGSNGPPCRHIRSKPFYPRSLLREWAKRQMTDIRSGAPAAAQGDAVDRLIGTAEGVTSIAVVLADPSASCALKAVLVAWSGRDPVDAANDAVVLRDLLEAEASRILGGR